MYYKTKKFRLLKPYVLHNIGGVSDRRWHDSLSLYYIDRESCHRLTETPPIFCIKEYNEGTQTFQSYSYFTHLSLCNVRGVFIRFFINPKKFFLAALFTNLVSHTSVATKKQSKCFVKVCVVIHDHVYIYIMYIYA